MNIMLKDLAYQPSSSRYWLEFNRLERRHSGYCSIVSGLEAQESWLKSDLEEGKKAAEKFAAISIAALSISVGVALGIPYYVSHNYSCRESGLGCVAGLGIVSFGVLIGTGTLLLAGISSWLSRDCIDKIGNIERKLERVDNKLKQERVYVEKYSEAARCWDNPSST